MSDREGIPYTYNSHQRLQLVGEYYNLPFTEHRHHNFKKMTKLLFVLSLILLFFVALSLGNADIRVAPPDGTAGASSTARVVHCTAFGFRSEMSVKILENILGVSESLKICSGMRLYDVDVTLDGGEKPLLALEYDRRASRNDSDIAVVYAHYASIINDAQTLVLHLNSALASVLAEGPKRSVVLVLAVPPKVAVTEYQNALVTLLSEAWRFLPEKDSLNNTDLSGKFDVQVLTYSLPPEGISNDFKFEKRNILEAVLKRQARSDYKTVDALIASGNFSTKKVENLNMKDFGLDTCLSAAEIATDWARQAANANLQKLQKPETATSFKAFLENLVEEALKEMDSFLEKEKCVPSSEARRFASDDVTRDIHDMMYPFFKRFVQLARQDIAKMFNNAVQNELEISIRIIEDLKTIKNRVLRKFLKDIDALIPKYAPEAWRINFEISQLEKTLDEFIEQREGQSKLQGILPRGRRPIEVSFFHFLLHPFGRDHRQDPLGMLQSDKLSYMPSLTQYPEVAVSPSTARFLANSAADKEFAREMLMLPLSIKNPSVPMSSKRSRKRSAPPQKDHNRALNGPERFIDWSKIPMNRVVKGNELEGPVEDKIIDKVINTIPYFGKGYYKHPSYNYGPKYSVGSKAN